MPPGAWYTVTAHTTAGDVTSYPGSRHQRQRGDSPEKLRDVRVERKGDAVIISWDKPRDRDKIDVIRGIVEFDGFGGGAARRITIDQDARFPTSMRVDIPKRGRWYDLHAELGLYNKGENGDVIGFRWMRPSDRSPAVYGSHVESIVAAGPRAVEVTGALSRMNAKRACGNTTCAGETAVLVVDGGRSNERFTVVFTSRGTFHELVRVDRGTKQPRVRIDGPMRLDSGPFVKVHVD